jgi:hypothetical protein
MPRRQPPEGYLTSTQAAQMLGCSVGMVYNYERAGQLHKKIPSGRKQGFFVLNEVKALAEGLSSFFDLPIEENRAEKDHLVFSQAMPDDMEGVYKVAASLFGDTTSAEARKPLVAQCPEGNYIVKNNDKIVAYIHIQPLKHDRMMAFMRGEIRGKHITAHDLDSFTPEKPVECLIKSVGAVKNVGNTEENCRHNQLRYIFKLLRGTALEMAKLGEKGVNITKIYATSETVTGIAMAFSAKMEQFGKPLGVGRFRFVLDVEKSDLPLLHPYKQAFAEWRKEHESVNFNIIGNTDN